MTIAVFLLSVAAIWRARTPYTVLGCGVFGFLSIYFMINPIKGSYSVPPTVVICAVIGLLTSRLALLKQQTSKLLTLATIGLLLGFLFNLRIANVLLLTGYAAMLLTGFINRRDLSSFFEGATLLAAAFVVSAQAQTPAPAPAPAAAPALAATPSTMDHVKSWSLKKWNAAKTEMSKNKAQWDACTAQAKKQKLTRKAGWAFVYDCMKKPS